MVQLTSEQIHAVDSFVKERYVQYDYVRIEIVDHLATEIENEMHLRPDDSFTKLLWGVGGKYGTELQSLVKQSERKLRWFWMKRIMLECLKSIFSRYILFPIVVYFVSLHYSFMGGFSLVAIVSFFIHRDRIAFGAANREDAEAERFLVTKTFKWVMSGMMFVSIVGFQLGRDADLWALGPIMIDGKALAVASLAAYIMMASFSFGLLESYYAQHPLLASKREEFKAEYANRKWRARKY